MGFLDLSKFKTDTAAGKEPAKNVPEQLPPLPDSPKPAQQPVARAAEPELAPHELPPLPAAERGPAPQPVTVKETRPVLDIPRQGPVVAKLEPTEYQKWVEQEISSSTTNDLIHNLNARFDQERNEERLTKIENSIVEKIKPIEQLEQDWRNLKREMVLRGEQLRNIEATIKQLSLEVRELIEERNSLSKAIELHTRFTFDKQIGSPKKKLR